MGERITALLCAKITFSDGPNRRWKLKEALPQITWVIVIPRLTSISIELDTMTDPTLFTSDSHTDQAPTPDRRPPPLLEGKSDGSQRLRVVKDSARVPSQWLVNRLTARMRI